jgi:3-hydroxyisobutyrate dehydrogenase-like beta-hydroxyacid dehydrogenase
MLAAGHEVTVWNRTSAKCAALAAAGARVAESISEAVGAADVVIVCVSDYVALRALLHVPSVSRLLLGKTVVQFTSRTPSEAHEGGAWAQQYEIDYLEGAIFCYPPSIGTEEATLVYAGLKSVFAATKDLLQSLGGQVVYVGQAIGSSAALDLGAVGTFVPGAVVSFLQGAALCKAEGASLEAYLDLVCKHALPTLAVATMKSSVEMIALRDFAYAEGGGAPLDVWVGGLKLATRAID